MADNVIRVLLVEDDEDDYILTRGILAEACTGRSKYDLHWASSYATGRDALLGGGYDVCLLDYRLGEQDGLALLREMTELLGPSAPPILLLTGQDTPETDREAMRAGAADYLVKAQITSSLLERSIRYTLERRKAERKRKEAERERDRLFELSQDLQCIADTGGYFLRLNPSWERVSGYSCAELTARPFLEFVHPEDQEATTVVMARLLANKPVIGFENRYSCKDGSYRWLQWYVTPSLTEGRLYASARDMTEQKQAVEIREQALEERERRFRALIENSADMIAVLSEGATIYASPSVYRTFGYSPEEVIGLDSFVSVHPDDQEESIQCLAQVTQTPGATASMELRVRHKDGSWRWVFTTATNLLHEPAVGGIVCNFHDITARKEAEEERVRLAAIVESSQEAIISNGLDGIITTWNVGAQNLFGYTAREAIGRPISMLAPSDRNEEVAQLLAKIRNNEPVRHYETVRVRKDGFRIDASLSISPLKDAAGNIVGASLIKRDITARKRAEDALRESENELRALTEAIPQIVWVTRPDGWHIHFNQRWMDYTGLTLEESLGHGWNPPFHPDDRPRAAHLWQQATQSGEAYEIEYRLRRADGTYRWMLGRALPLRDALGTIVKWFGTCTDIHDLKQAEEALQKEREFFAALVENVSDGIVSCDANGVITFFNGATRQFHGLPAEPIPSDQWAQHFDLFLPDGKTLMTKEQIPLFRALQDGSVRDIEMVIAPGDGTPRRILASGRAFCNAQGQKVGAVVAMHDITEQRRLQEQVIQSERLAAMGELVAGVAHEINNPLAAISGIAQLLQMHPDEQVQEDAQTISKMTDRANRIVRSLLTFARQASTVDQRPVLLQPLIEETLDIIRYKLRKSNIEVVLNLAEPDLSPVVNPGQIEQVLLNLINNAEHALREQHESRRITITTCRRVQEDRVWAFICVSDNGHGMAEEVMGRIFNPFFTTKAQGEGTGLGLSICHGIVQEHQGRLEVTSQVGVGTTFTLTLPLAFAPDMEQSSTSAHDARQSLHETR